MVMHRKTPCSDFKGTVLFSVCPSRFPLSILAHTHVTPGPFCAKTWLVVLSWDGERVEAIAKALGCSPQSVRRRLHRFDAEGIEGLGDRPRSGRPSRLTEE